MTELRELMDDISTLQAESALHRKGYRASEVTDERLLKHLVEESVEVCLDPHDIKEAGDVLAILLHHIQRQGWNLEAVARVARLKLRERYTEHTLTPIGFRKEAKDVRATETRTNPVR